MNEQSLKIEQTCPCEEIGLYLDGELSAQDELVFEKHLAVCPVCFDELNSQKEMFSVLDLAFESKSEIELPKDFTKVIVTKAESGVNGLRSKKERFSALFLCAGLFLLIMLGLGAESERAFGTITALSRQFAAIISFIFHLLLDISTGAVVVLRSLSQHLVSNQIFLFALILGALAISIFTVSRYWLRFSRS